jgi:hypothetical protein
VYLPGDEVTGWVYLEGYTTIPCLAVRCELSHTARVAWHEGNVTIGRGFLGEREYVRSARTVWGALYETDAALCAGGGGGDVAFEAREGEVLVPLAAAQGSLLALRVLRADRGRDCLGACALDVDVLLAKPGAKSDLPLLSAAGARSAASVTVSATLSAVDDEAPEAPGRQGVRRVLLRVHAARSLPGTGPATPVSCQLYELPEAPPPGEPVPPPDAEAQQELPMEICVPFRFVLPAGGLPSSMEWLPRELDYGYGGLDGGYVRCNVDARVDLGGRAGRIEARASISIAQPVPPSLPRLLAPAAASTRLQLYPQRWYAEVVPVQCLELLGGRECYEDRSAALGALSLHAALPCRGFAPGGAAQLRLYVANSTPHEAVVHVEFVRLFSLREAGGQRYAAKRSQRVLELPLAAGSDRQYAVELRVPLMAPDFHGSRAGGADDEPLRWRTLLRVSATFPEQPYGLGFAYLDLPLFICGAPLESAAAAASLAPAPVQEAMSTAAAKVQDATEQVSMADADAAHDAFDVIVTDQELAGSKDVAAFRTAAQQSREEDESESAWPLVARMAEPPLPAPKQGPRGERLRTYRVGAGDTSAPKASKDFAPAYFVARPAAPLRVASPHAPSAPLVDVAHRPPGALMLCPHTKVNFTVPYPPPAL